MSLIRFTQISKDGVILAVNVKAVCEITTEFFSELYSMQL